ncbi:hypothetical protein HYX02_04455 [Candidatus Woesearchaeota archaeon]|nr:hypothetical protein [Candidatus Woesearchaeota archaeon]
MGAPHTIVALYRQQSSAVRSGCGSLITKAVTGKPVIEINNLIIVFKKSIGDLKIINQKIMFNNNA